MKIDRDELQALKNFTQLNDSIVINEEKFFASIAKSGAVLGSFHHFHTFPKQFGIYDIRQFINVLSLFENPELDFGENIITISDGGAEVEYHMCDLALLKSIVVSKLPNLDFDDHFELKSEELDKITTASSIMDFDMISISDGKLKAFNKTMRQQSNTFELDIDLTTDKEVVIKTENLKIPHVNYNVQVSDRVVHFQSETTKYGSYYQFWVSTEKNK